VVAVGDLARDFLTGAAGERWFATVDECIAALPETVPPGSAVLVKASRLLRLERVAEALAKAGADAPEAGQDAPSAGLPDAEGRHA
jgi:UDP-N-acetylmuramyl pentapeptide synthase